MCTCRTVSVACVVSSKRTEHVKVKVTSDYHVCSSSSSTSTRTRTEHDECSIAGHVFVYCSNSTYSTSGKYDEIYVTCSELA